jgi:D-glycero-alpha-D-manno-heptose-7-phosphate kinase
MKSIYSRAPVRIGLIGGGTDLNEFCDHHTGHIINCAIKLYNHTYLEMTPNDQFVLEMANLNTGDNLIIKDLNQTEVPAFLQFISASINYLNKKHNVDLNFKFKVIIESDIQEGSGLGGSSSMMVSIIGAFNKAFELGLSKHEIARCAYEIERIELNIYGGSQDFYASAFGGVNHMHFIENTVLVNKLLLDTSVLLELETSILMFYTGVRREAKIIELEKKVILSGGEKIDKMIELAGLAKNSIRYLTDEKSIPKFGEYIRDSWKIKKDTSSKVTSKLIEEIISVGYKNNAYGGKISGAGSGGYGFFVMEPKHRPKIKDTLKIRMNIESFYVNLDSEGLKTIVYEH